MLERRKYQASGRKQLPVKPTLAHASKLLLWLYAPAWLAAAQGFTLRFLHGKVAHVYWAMTQPKPPKSHGSEATQPWVTQAGFLQRLLQQPPGPSIWLTRCFCVPLPKATAEQTAVLEEVWSFTGGRKNFRAPTAVLYTWSCVLLLLALMLLRAYKQDAVHMTKIHRQPLAAHSRFPSELLHRFTAHLHVNILGSFAYSSLWNFITLFNCKSQPLYSRD